MKLNRKKLAQEIVKRMNAGDSVASQVAALLIDNNQTSQLSSLLRDVQEIRAQSSGIVEVKAVSSHPLTSDQREEIEQATRSHFPGAKQIIIQHEQKPEVVGGVALSFPGANLDLTVRAKLNQLRTLTT